MFSLTNRRIFNLNLLRKEIEARDTHTWVCLLYFMVLQYPWLLNAAPFCYFPLQIRKKEWVDFSYPIMSWTIHMIALNWLAYRHGYSNWAQLHHSTVDTSSLFLHVTRKVIIFEYCRIELIKNEIFQHRVLFPNVMKYELDFFFINSVTHLLI